jgi:hypothetical protein
MAVVIHEFEIVSEPAKSDASGEEKQESAAPPVSPHDVEGVIARQYQRLARIWAH